MVHTPVLAAAAVAALEPRDGGTYVDATFGGGGYTRLLLAAARCRVVAFDRDPDAAARARDLAAEGGRDLVVVEAPFGRMAEELADRGLGAADGAVFDLGVSSFQLDDPARGFSFRHAGPLDMRMGREGPSAADLVNTLEEAELARLLRELGDEPDARRIARAVCEDRRRTPFSTTDALAGLVARVKRRGHGGGRDPATLTFQALRMAVNDELGELARGLEAAEAVLRPGGRLATVSFHSGEDALVKRFVDARGGRRPEPNRHAPPVDAAELPDARWRWVSRKVAVPDADETGRNRRARSARLRVAERLAARPAATGGAAANDDEGGGGEGGRSWRLAA